MLYTEANNDDRDNHKIEFKKFFKNYRDVIKNPYEFLSVQPEKAEQIKILLKELYAWNICEDGANKDPEILADLVLDGMDEEQIWQQIELHSNWIWPKLLVSSSRLLSSKEDKFLVNLSGSEPNKITKTSDDEEYVSEMSGEEDYFKDADGMSDEDENNTDPGVDLKKFSHVKKKHKKSIVDDKFFNLREMEEFLNVEDEREKNKDSSKGRLQTDDVDYFQDGLTDEDEDEENVNYKDFFEDTDEEDAKENDIDETENYNGENIEEEHSVDEDFHQENDDLDGENENEYDLNQLSQHNEFDKIDEHNSDVEDSDEDGFEDENKIKSTFEMRQERLKNRIEEYEEQALSEKPWQLKGEIVGSGRPQNSLLQEVLEFDSTTRPAPVITEETSLRLEDIIKQRIKDKVWDDVERKVKPIQTPQQFRKTVTLDQEKSKLSLAQIYEKEYQKELEKLDPNRNENEEEPKQHKEIKNLMKSLFNKLDALSNFHYTPKPVAPEPRIITNTPAVNMEEVAPVAVSNAKLLAPEEIKDHAKGDIIGKTERSRTDKNRERRKKKIKQRAIHKAQDERILEKQKQGIKLTAKEEQNKMLKTVMKSKNVQKAKKSVDGTLTSSKAFFTQLQDKQNMKTRKDRKKPPIADISAKRLKL